MITEYPLVHQPAIAGMTEGDHRSHNLYLPKPAEVWTLTLTDSSEAGDLVITITDNETNQSWSLTVAISGVVEATSLDEIKAAWELDPKFNDLFSVEENGALLFTATARHIGRSYTITTTPPGSMSVTPAKTVESTATGLEFGLCVAKSTTARQYGALTATSELADVAGVTKRTDGNHFHEIPDAAAGDTTIPLKQWPIPFDGVVWLQCEEAMTPGSDVYIRRAQTSSAGKVGAIRATPQGSAHTFRLTAVADKLLYGLEFDYLGKHYSAYYTPTDATTAAGDAVDGVVAALGSITGLTITDNADGTFDIICAAGTQLENARINARSLDADDLGLTASTIVAADVDTIDASSKITVLENSINSPTISAPGLVKCRVHFL